MVEDVFLPIEFPFVLAGSQKVLPTGMIFIYISLGVTHTAHVIWIQNPSNKRAGLWLGIVKGGYCYYCFPPLTAITMTDRSVHWLPLLQVDFS